MRLIDADKAKEVLRGLLYETAMNNIRYANVYEDLAKNRMDIWFNLIPTVEAVPTEFHDKCQQIEIQKRLKLEEELKEAEHIVRCKDCVFYGDSIRGIPTQGYCEKTEFMTKHDNDYCSWGERKTK